MSLTKKNFLIILAASTLLVVLFSFIIKDSERPSSLKAGKVATACSPVELSGLVDLSAQYAYFEGSNLAIPGLAVDQRPIKVLGVASEERWIEVDISEQRLKAWEGDRLFLETAVSTGLPWYPTPTGEFRVWIKLRATKMEGGSGKYYYYLPNVPYVMFFENEEIPGWRGYGLHGTYWHNDFGTQRSHGCVNLPTDIAKELYYWTTPVLPEGKSVVRSAPENVGTRIVIHE